MHVKQPGPDQRLDPPNKTSGGEMLGRRYSGLEPCERAVERKRRLVAAGVDVFGTVGYSGATIKTLCRSAGLSERYFYESFASREQLLGASYDYLDEALGAQIDLAVQSARPDLIACVRVGTEAVVGFMLNDPRHARIMLMEVVGVSAELELKHHKSQSDFATRCLHQLLLLSGIDPELGREQLATRLGSVSAANILEYARLLAVFIVGGVNNMMLDALGGGTTQQTAQITEVTCSLIFNAAAGIREFAEGP